MKYNRHERLESKARKFKILNLALNLKPQQSITGTDNQMQLADTLLFLIVKSQVIQEDRFLLRYSFNFKLNYYGNS